MISGTITNAFSFCLKKSFNSIMRVLDEADFGDDKIHFLVTRPLKGKPDVNIVFITGC